MRELPILVLLVLIALLSVFVPRLIHAYRRTYWKRVAAHVESAYFEVHGKNACALVDLSWHDVDKKRMAKRIPTRKLDITETPPGSTLFILFNPANPARCVVDSE